MSSGAIITFVVFAIVLILAVWLAYLTAAFKSYKGQHKELNEALEKGKTAEVVAGNLDNIDKLSKGLEEASAVCDERAVEAEKAIQGIGLVRFNAFDDVGGELSFATALLDDQGNGLVISAINGREQARCYSKPVVGGKSKYTLSDEEQQAIDEALGKPSRLRIAGEEEMESLPS